MLAELVQSPSAYNPIVNPERLKLRQAYILNNMLEEGMIGYPAATRSGFERRVTLRAFCTKHRSKRPCTLPKWCAKSCLRNTAKMLTPQGFKVYTTVDTAHQRVDTEALT